MDYSKFMSIFYSTYLPSVSLQSFFFKNQRFIVTYDELHVLFLGNIFINKTIYQYNYLWYSKPYILSELKSNFLKQIKLYKYNFYTKTNSTRDIYEPSFLEKLKVKNSLYYNFKPSFNTKAELFDFSLISIPKLNLEKKRLNFNTKIDYFTPLLKKNLKNFSLYLSYDVYRGYISLIHNPNLFFNLISRSYMYDYFLDLEELYYDYSIININKTFNAKIDKSILELYPLRLTAMLSRRPLNIYYHTLDHLTIKKMFS
jgi:hypothetical protein